MALNPVPNYPASLDSLPDPSSSTYTDDAGYELDLMIQLHNAILEALENKLGADSAAAGAMLGYIRRSDAAGAGSWVPETSLALYNPIVNASLDSWPEGATFTSIANATYGPDGFVYGKVGAVVHDLLRSTDVPAVAYNAPLGNYSLQLDVTTVDAAIAAGDYCIIATRIEGYDFLPFAQQAFCLSFWVKAAKTGTHCCYFKNSGSDRTYVGTYTVSVADTWEFKTIAVLASPSAGTWDYTTGIGLEVGWALSCGSTFQTTAGAWATGDFKGTSAQVNETDNTANNFRIFAPRIALGTMAGIFHKLPVALNRARCLRYFFKTFPEATTPAQNSSVLTGALEYISSLGANLVSGLQLRYPVQMRATPTVTYFNPSAANNKWRNVTASADSGTGTTVRTDHTALTVLNTQVAGDTTQCEMIIHLTANARL